MHLLILPTWYVSPERPDLGIYFREHALAMAKSGQTVGVLYVGIGLFNLWGKGRKPHPPGHSFYIDEGVATLRVDTWGFPKRFAWSQQWYAQQVSKYYLTYCQKVGTPDIIHAQGYTAGYAASWLKDRWKVPFVYSEHLSTLKNHQYPASHDRMLQAALRNADAITAVSSALAGWLGEKTARPIQVVPNLVDTHFFRPDPSKKAQTFTFLYVGDLIPIKAPDVLLRAFSIFLASNTQKNVRLDLVGTGRMREALEKLVQSLAISEHIHFHGLLSATAVVGKMQAAHCLVLSSQTETFGVVQIEAMSCGLPIIATDCGGPADVVTRETGLLVKVGDADALANAMQTILEQAANYDPIKIRASAVERFGAVKVSQKWIQLYHKVIESNRQ